jgi:hypothetical protein
LEIPPPPRFLASKGKVTGFVKFRAERLLSIVPRNDLDSHLYEKATDHVWFERMRKESNLGFPSLQSRLSEVCSWVVANVPGPRRCTEYSFAALEPWRLALLCGYAEKHAEEGEGIIVKGLLLDL